MVEKGGLKVYRDGSEAIFSDWFDHESRHLGAIFCTTRFENNRWIIARTKVAIPTIPRLDRLFASPCSFLKLVHFQHL
jgi:hypothetical protein